MNAKELIKRISMNKSQMLSKSDWASYFLCTDQPIPVLKWAYWSLCFLVWFCIHWCALGADHTKRVSNRYARLIAVGLLSSLVIISLSLAIWGLVAFFRSDAGNLQNLMQKLADMGGIAPAIAAMD